MFRFVAVALAALWCAAPAKACMAPQFEDHHFPSCTIPLPAAGARVTLIYGDGPADLSPYHLGAARSETRLVRVHVGANAARNYLVLSAHGQTIWQFDGAVDSIADVVVLGATSIGPEAAGVIGVPAERVHFTHPDLAALGGVQQTSCTRIALACITAQWFGDVPGDRVTFHPASAQPRLAHDAEVSWQRMRMEANRGDDTAAVKPVISLVVPEQGGRMAAVDPAAVVSVNPPQPYALLPGAPGLQALVASGALVPMGQGDSVAIVRGWAQTFSARYRSRFDPGFLLVPKVDYIVTRAVTLPPELPPTALMVAKGVPAPQMNGNDGYRVCLYFADRAGERLQKMDMFSNECRQQTVSQAIPSDQQDALGAAQTFDVANLGNDRCQITTFPEGTEVMAIALSEGEQRRYRDDPVRRIDVQVKRGGPTVLYVSMEGGRVQWNVTGPQVVAIYARGSELLGLDTVVLNGAAYAYDRLSNPNEGCPEWEPLFPNHLGPAIAHLDGMFRALTGQPLDRLITHTDTGRAWRVPDAPVPVYVVE